MILVREAVEVPLVLIVALLVSVSERVGVEVRLGVLVAVSVLVAVGVGVVVGVCVVVGVSLLLCELLRVLVGVPAATTTTTAPTTIHSSTSPLINGASLERKLHIPFMETVTSVLLVALRYFPSTS